MEEQTPGGRGTAFQPAIDDLNLLSRTLALVPGQNQLVRANIPNWQGWQFSYQMSPDVVDGTINFQSLSNIAQTNYVVDYGGSTGDIVTGQGSVEITLTNPGLAVGTINFLMSNINPQDQPGSHTEPTQALPGVGVFVDVGNFGGRCPFPFTRFSIWVNANVDLRFVDDVGAVQVVILNLAPNDRLLKESLMPKRWRVQIAPTVINQTAFVTWSR